MAEPERVLLADPIAPEGVARLRDEGIVVEERDGLDEPSLASALADFDGLVVRSATRVTAAALARADRLRVIGRAGVGVDNVDLDAATRRGIIVLNTPDANAVAAAELAFAHLLSLARHLVPADRGVRDGRWERASLAGTELDGKTIGIVGLGRIGRAVAERALAFRMRILAYDPYLAAGSPLAAVELVPFDRLLAESDFVTLHAPLNEASARLFDARAIARMKRGARLVNCARGGLIDERALAAALREGRLAGAALDTFEVEPLPGDHPLRDCPNAAFTPHLGASTEEAQRKVALEIAAAVADVLRRGIVRNAVNAPSLAPEVFSTLAPVLALGEKMGSFLGQFVDGPLVRVELAYRGELHALDVAPLRAAFLAGMLRPILDAPVNFVNAPLVAAERDLEVLESRDPRARDFVQSIGARGASASGRSASVSGTVFGRSPRLVQVDDFHLDLLLEGHLLVTRHRDRPGVLGRIGTLLGDLGINISRVQLGVPDGSAPGGDREAMAFLNVDSPVPPDALAAVRALPQILSAKTFLL